MAIENFCAAHWGAREPQYIQPEATLVDGAVCSFCDKPAARAAGHEAEPPPVIPIAALDVESVAALETDVAAFETGIVAGAKRRSMRPQWP